MPAGGYGGKTRLHLLEGFKTKLTLHHQILRALNQLLPEQ